MECAAEHAPQILRPKVLPSPEPPDTLEPNLLGDGWAVARQEPKSQRR